MAADPPKPPPRPPRPGLVGPLFGWELVRLARRGQDARARFVLAAALLVALTAFTAGWFRHTLSPADVLTGTARAASLQESAEYASAFALTFVFAQLAVLVLLAPAYAAGGLAEEKDKKTYPYLLVSDLRAREIVAGKFLGRLVFLLGVMAAGLPILTLTLLFGGVSPHFLLVSYLLTAATVALLTAAGVWAAAAADTFRGAMFRAYGAAVLHAVSGCGLHPAVSPFGVLAAVYALEPASTAAFWAVGLGFPVLQLAAAGWCVWQAERAVRKARAAPVRRVAPPADRPGGLPKPRPVAPVAHPYDDHRPPVDDADPFLWKEKHVRGVRRTADDEAMGGVTFAVGVVAALTVAGLVAVGLLVLAVSGDPAHAAGARRLFVTGGGVGLFAHLLTVGTAACGTVCRERQRLTLESLLAVPADGRDILWPKWRVSGGRGLGWGLPAVALLAAGVAATAGPGAGLAAVGYGLAAVSAAAGHGLWLSIRCRTQTRAVMWFLPTAGGLTSVPVAVWAAGDPAPTAVRLAIAGAVAAVAAWGLWRRAAADFERTV